MISTIHITTSGGPISTVVINRGATGPAPSGTGFVKVVSGVLQTPSDTIPSSAITGLGDSAGMDVGTTAGTVAAGDHNHAGVYQLAGTSVQEGDARLTDARTPTAHTHPLAELTGVTPAAIGAATSAQGTDERIPTAAGLIDKFATTAAAILDADRVAIFDSSASFAPKHALFSVVWEWIITKLGALPSITAGGAWSFASSTRPTSSGTGTPAAMSLITRADGDTRFGAVGLANTSSISITSQATPQTIRSAALAVGVYHVRMVFLLTGTVNTGTRHGYNFSGTSTIRFFRSRASSAPYVQVTSTPSFDQGLTETSTSAVIEGIIQVTVAGTLSMQAAQNTSHPDSLSVGASSHMIITPCPNGSIS